MSLLLFLGAGASAEFGVPLFRMMAKKFPKEGSYKKHAQKIKEINLELKKVGFCCDIENYIAYSKGRSKPKEHLLKMNPFISHFVSNCSCKRLGYDSSAKKLTQDLEEYVYDNLYINEYAMLMRIFSHYDKFFHHLRRRFRRNWKFKESGLDIFTTNYDNILEEYAESKGFSYFDGYLENPDGLSYFSPELYRKTLYQLRLYKLHGSVRLGTVQNIKTKEKRIIHTPRRITIDEIYRINWKIIERIMLLGYDKETSKDPYFELLGLLKEKLRKTDTVVVIGYSFGDVPILNVFRDVLNIRDNNFQIVILCDNADKIKDEKFSNDSRIRSLSTKFSGFANI